MNWGKAIGYGIVLYAIMFLVASVLMFGVKLTGDVFGVSMLVITAVILYFAAGMYKVKSLNDGLQVGLVWLVIEAILDYTVIVQIFNKGSLSFYNWSLLTAYVLIVAIPAIVGQMAKK
ncbi:hypothetical protein A2625_00500 [candidate division WOR-1 bacterium RIFCSPHIGHO2_01_FULL_53_15]|uniref:Uncharacterized protein n=1 Tax=candidate division WOR-1 bacterium RIFCSPHIGHO2_01_FULL_53_15 TaxID=1802564 RepID=A0A1F4Q0I0_UNCSA|nr:MAG: hypothetical protein A2625_00500 [candidate division WOR-1 bacterium RIFCSPHIGHO2_01_FULL_53_15]OGC13543.1 MAG: hypothetical protein A3D23_07115 [candidate division WOR-1 bacterium RIFCSPHIGHO2_02_FULL_53_26]